MHVTVPAADADLAADVLLLAGAAAVEERSLAAAGSAVVLVAGPPAGGDAEPLLAAVAGRWPADLVPVDLGAALDAWRDHARPVRVGPLVVRPPWVAADPGGTGDPAIDVGPVDLVIDPGRAFGSGAHVSTRLALAALIDLVHGGDAVLDVGCGSGVLAIAALRLGAASAVGIDVDPAAVAATRANAERNREGGRLTVVEGDASGFGGLPARAFDVVVANMLVPDVVAAAPTVAHALAPGGAAVLAGILATQAPTVEDAYRAVGLDRGADPRTEDGWTALVVGASGRG